MSIKTKNRGKRFAWLCPKVRKSLFPAKEIVWHKLPVKHQIIVVTVLEGRSLLSVALYLLHWHEGFIFSSNSAGKPLSAFCCKISDFPFNIIMIADWTLLLNTHCFLRLHTASAPKLSKVWTWITLTARFFGHRHISSGADIKSITPRLLLTVWRAESVEHKLVVMSFPSLCVCVCVCDTIMS